MGGAAGGLPAPAEGARGQNGGHGRGGSAEKRGRSAFKPIITR